VFWGLVMHRQQGFNNMRVWSFFGNPRNYPFHMGRDISGNYHTKIFNQETLRHSKVFNADFCRSIIRRKDHQYYEAYFKTNKRSLNDLDIVR
jgi:hypothetical protein